jgi:hypothetical protein
MKNKTENILKIDVIGKETSSQAWRCTLVMLAFGKWKQEDGKFEESLAYRARSCLSRVLVAHIYNPTYLGG